MGRRPLGDQIAILEGFDLSSAEVDAGRGEAALSIAGGSHTGGAAWAPGMPTLYGRAGLAGMSLDDYIVSPEKAFMDYMNDTPTLAPQKRVIAPAGGANYTGGSEYTPGFPFTTSAAGLAGANMRRATMAGSAASVLRRVGPGTLVRTNVIDPSEGANYGGGSDYAPGLPLMPSSVGLAAALDQGANLMRVLRPAMPRVDKASMLTRVGPGTLVRTNVIDPSEGANYGGGSDYAPGLPLMPSSVGLAYVDDYGITHPQLSGCADCGAMGDLAAMDLSTRQIMPGVTMRTNVIDPSQGADYGGGSSYAPGLPLLPSTVGLAELGTLDGLDGVSNEAFRAKFVDAAARARFDSIAGAAPMRALRAKIKAAKKLGDAATLDAVGRQLAIARMVRRSILSLPVGARVTADQVSGMTSMAAAHVAAGALSGLEGRIGRRIKKGIKKAAKGAVRVAKKAAPIIKPFAKIAMTAVGIPPLPYAKLAKTAVRGVKAAAGGKKGLKRFARSTFNPRALVRGAARFAV